MLKTGLRLNVLLVAMGLILSVASCGESDPPAARAAGILIERHFESPVYRGLVDVVDFSVKDIQTSSFDETEFHDVEMEVDIYVEEGYIISRIFTHGAFEVDDQWPENRKERLDAAPDEEARQEVIDLYERDTFSAGKHTIRVFYSMVEVDSGWTSVDFVLNAHPRPGDEGDLAL